MNILSAIKKNLRPVTQLAAPVVAAELAWHLMGIVDLLMIGRVDAISIAAVSLGNAAAFAIVIFGIGLTLGLDFFISRDFAAGDRKGCQETLVQSLYLSSGLTPILMVLLFIVPQFLVSWGIEEAILSETQAYLNGIIFSIGPMLLYTVFRRYLQAIDKAYLILWVFISANVINVIADWIFIFGNLGMPTLGATGAGWATCFSRLYLFLFLGFLVWREELKFPHPDLSLRPNFIKLKEVLKLGLPAAVQITLEVGVFAGATALAGRIDVLSLAAHQIALSVVSTTFMIPMGISSAAAVRVGQALGVGKHHQAVGAGWASLAMGVSAMAISSACLVLFGWPIARAFTDQVEIIPLAVSLLGIGAIFQMVDAVQVICTGISRGLGDTRTPLITNFIGHWCFGLPIGYTLAFHFDYGVQGLWIGLCCGLAFVAIPLISIWYKRSTSMLKEHPEEDQTEGSVPV